MSSSPVEDGLVAPPASLPLGVSFSDRVTIDEIDYHTSKAIYEEHHSYMPSGRGPGTPTHHGIYLDGRLVGAISYSYLFCSSPIAGVPSDKYMEVSRVCVALDMPNLASCAMAKSQEKFAREYAAENDIELLVTYVREDYEGSMFAALKDKGWKIDGVSEGHQTPNRPDTEIREYDKVRWVCPLTRPDDE